MRQKAVRWNQYYRSKVRRPAIPSIIRFSGLSSRDLPAGTVLVAIDGTRRRIADSVSPITSADGSVRGAVIVFSDETVEAIPRCRETAGKGEIHPVPR